MLSTGGPSAASAQAFDPIAGGGAVRARGRRERCRHGRGEFAGAGRRRLHRARIAARVIADLTVTGTAASSMLAARLLDVDANGDELLVSRGIYRPDASGRQVFQLAPMGFRIRPDHHSPARADGERGAHDARLEHLVLDRRLEPRGAHSGRRAARPSRPRRSTCRRATCPSPGSPRYSRPAPRSSRCSRAGAARSRRARAHHASSTLKRGPHRIDTQQG